jgi:phage head maturation protease
MEHILDEEMKPVTMSGIAIRFNHLSSCPVENGLRELILPDAVSEGALEYTSLRYDHGESAHVLGERSIRQNLTFRVDDMVGVGFECGPFSIQNRWARLAIREIAAGRMCQMSFGGMVVRDYSIESIGGEKVNVVSRFERIGHICPAESGAYRETAVWLSTQSFWDLPSLARDLRRCWENLF